MFVHSKSLCRLIRTVWLTYNICSRKTRIRTNTRSCILYLLITYNPFHRGVEGGTYTLNSNPSGYPPRAITLSLIIPHMLSYLGNLCVGSQIVIPHIEQRSAIDTNLSKTNDTLSFLSKMHHIATSCNSMAATVDRLSTRIVVRDAYLCLAVHLLGLGVPSGREIEDHLRLWLVWSLDIQTFLGDSTHVQFFPCRVSLGIFTIGYFQRRES